MKRNKSPTIKDVAAAAGVSVGTVSAVIHEKKWVDGGIRKRVHQAIEKIGYSPNAIAQSMRLGSTRTIGIIVRDISVPAVAAFMGAAQDVCYDAGYASLVASFGQRRDREIDLIKVLARRKVDGFLVSHDPEADTELHNLLKSTRIPTVLIEREQPEWADAVLVNHRDAIRRATEYLIRLGHRRIALLVGNPALFPSRERIIGFEMAHEALRVPIDANLKKTQSYMPEYGYRETMRLTESAKHIPTAIIAGGPLLSGVLRALASRRLRIPDDISIVATSNSDLAELTAPPISTERWDAGEVGITAARMLLERVVHGSSQESRRIVLPAEFSVRDSCASPSSTVDTRSSIASGSLST